MSALFTIRDLRVAPRGQCILDVPALTLPKRGHTAIIGPNGAGKSTLLRALLGSYGGEIHFLNQEIKQAVAARRLAWVGQHGQFAIPLTVAEYVQLGEQSSRFAWFPKAQSLTPQALALLKLFDLQPFLTHRIAHLSGGEQQRANIVRALLQNAPALLLDEPLNHLDIRYQQRLMQYLNRQQTAFNAVIVLHDLEMAANYAAHVVILSRGKVVAAGAPSEVMTDDILSEVYQWPIHLQMENGYLRVQVARGVEE